MKSRREKENHISWLCAKCRLIRSPWKNEVEGIDDEKVLGIYFSLPIAWEIVALNQIYSGKKCKLNKMTVQETMPIAKGS